MRARGKEESQEESNEEEKGNEEEKVTSRIAPACRSEENGTPKGLSRFLIL